MILARVPILNSLWSGTGTVIVVCGNCCCMTIWLPRRRTSTNPWLRRMETTWEPERTRSLPNLNLQGRQVEFLVEPVLDFLRAGRLKK